MDTAGLIKLLETLVTYVNKDSEERTSGIAEGFYSADAEADWLAYNDALRGRVTAAINDLRGKGPKPSLGIVVRNGIVLHAVSDAPDRIAAVVGTLFVTDCEDLSGHQTPLALAPLRTDQAGSQPA